VLKGSARVLKVELGSAQIASHGAVTRPFLISALQQLSINPNSSSALQFLKKNIDSLPEAGFSAATIYDTDNKELLNVGHFTKDLSTSLALNSDAGCVFHANWTPIPRQTGQSERSDAGVIVLL
jgi:hypothetical protein